MTAPPKRRTIIAPSSPSTEGLMSQPTVSPRARGESAHRSARHHARGGARKDRERPGVPEHAAAADAFGARAQLAQGADSGAPGFERGLARHPGGDLLPVAHLDVEADAPASEGGATDPGAGVRNAEVGARIACASEPRLLTASEHELARTHRAIEELPERAQRERDAGATGMLLRPVRAEPEPIAVRQPARG